MNNDTLKSAIRQCLANPTLTGALARILKGDDEVALAVIRTYPASSPEALEAAAVLRHNDRFRSWFTSCLEPTEENPLV